MVDRCCLRPPVPTLPAAFKLLGCVFLPLRAVVRRWQRRRPQCANPAGALKLMHACTFTSLRAMLRRWWSRDLFGSHHFRHMNEARSLLISKGQSLAAGSPWCLRLSRSVPALCKSRYLRARARVHRSVVLKCTLMPMLSIIHRWWDLHFLAASS